MAINLNIAVNQALGEMSYLVSKKQASIIRNQLPSLDVELRDIKRVFYLLLYNVISSGGGLTTPRVEISSMRDLNKENWVIEIQSNVTKLNGPLLKEATSAVNKLGGLLEYTTKHRGSFILFTLPYNKVSV